VWIVPIYYLIFVRRAWSRKPDAHHVLMGLGLVVMYLLLFLLASFLFGFSTNRLVLLFLVAVPSAVTLTFEGEITTRMIERMSPKGLEEGDIIAFNMMSPNEKRHFARYPGFGRLATKQLIVRLKREKAKLPVYRNAAPLAFFILIGVVISLLFGNLALLIV
jgi:hypothetical protein